MSFDLPAPRPVLNNFQQNENIWELMESQVCPQMERTIHPEMAAILGPPQGWQIHGEIAGEPGEIVDTRRQKLSQVCEKIRELRAES